MGSSVEKRRGERPRSTVRNIQGAWAQAFAPERTARRRLAAASRPPALLVAGGLALVKIIADFGEGVGEVIAHKRHRANDHDSDQRSDEAIFNRGGALFLAEESTER
jgi:hypothetical protein